MNTNSSQLKSGAVMSYLAIIFNVVAGLIYTPWMIEQIGQSDYGLYTLATTFLSYFIMDFGLGNSISRFISKYRAENNKEKIHNFIGLIIKLYLFLTLLILVVIVIIFFSIDNIFLKLSAEEIQKFKVVFIIVGFYSVISFPFSPLNGVLISYEKFFYLKLCDVINKILTIVLMIILLLSGAKLYGLVVVNALVGVIVILIKLIIIKKEIPLKINFSYWDSQIFREILNYSIWITVMVIAQQLLINIAPTLLGMVSGTIAVSIFSIGGTIKGYVWSFSNALNGLFMPKVARISDNEKGLKEIDDLMIKVGRIQLFIIGIIIIGFISLGKDFIQLWLGSNFKDSYYVAVLLIIPNIITVTQDIANTKLYVIGEVKYRALIFIFSSMLSVVITLLLSPLYGAIGASIGIFVAMTIGHVVIMNVLYYKLLKINIKKFFSECHLNMAPPLIISLIFGLLLQYIFTNISIFCFLLKGILFTIVYIVLMWNISLKSYEKNLFKDTMKKIICMIIKK